MWSRGDALSVGGKWRGKVRYSAHCVFLYSYSMVNHDSVDPIFYLQEACAQYWPSEGSSKFGEFTVNLVDKEGTPGFVMRKFIIESNKVCSHSIMFLQHDFHNFL